MLPSLEKLKKFFRLEHESGYQNRAVIGGLAKILDFWVGEARNEKVSEELIDTVASRLENYHSLSPQGRADILKGVWKRVQTLAGGSADETSSSAPEPETAPASVSPAAAPAPAQQMPTPPSDSARERKARPPRSASSQALQTSQTPAALNAKLTVLSGIGVKYAHTLEKLGLYTLGDMLYNFPRRYVDYSQLKLISRLWYGETVTVIGLVQSAVNRALRGGKMTVTEVIISDGTGALRLSYFNQPWRVNHYKEGEAVSVSGKIEQYLGRLVMNNPDFEPVEADSLHTNRIVPVYALAEKINQKWLREKMNEVVGYWAARVADPLPESVLDAVDLESLGEALTQAHFPDSQPALDAARKRLAFDEIFYLQVGVQRQKRDWLSVSARAFQVEDAWLQTRLSALPFTLTAAQKNTVEDIRLDLKSGKPMNRLIQGDVGSGKTVVAALAAEMVFQSGAQAAIMAPTGILAEQHYQSLSKLLTRAEEDSDFLRPEQVRLLVGDTSAAERRDILSGLASGEIKMLVGTHALIESPVSFKDLQFVVIDEQHRFGVEQRAALRAKGDSPHLLVMTATPIPRSLALTLYGDLDLSVMDEMPEGRQPVATYVLTPQERERAFSLIRAQVKSGKQIFIVFPLVEETDKTDSKAAVEEHARLQKEIFPDLKLGLLHGRMKPEEKDAVMAQFRDGQFDVLVSTTVVEVGVDVPNATVMLIEGANRFGLAQLHQLRGRVGRGGGESFCLLIPDHEDKVENERLQAMVQTNNGFELADLDLKQRGPGEFLGTRQSGYAVTLKMASLTDIGLIEQARAQAESLFALDPDLTNPEHVLLAEAVDRFWSNRPADAS